jgi:hypothetical protein
LTSNGASRTEAQRDGAWPERRRLRIWGLAVPCGALLGLPFALEALQPLAWVAAVPFLFLLATTEMPDGAGPMRKIASQLDTPLLLGGIGVTVEDGITQHANSGFLVSEAGEIQGRYDKQALVAFGEYVPLVGRSAWLRLRVGEYLLGTYRGFDPFLRRGTEYRLFPQHGPHVRHRPHRSRDQATRTPGRGDARGGGPAVGSGAVVLGRARDLRLAVRPSRCADHRRGDPAPALTSRGRLAARQRRRQAR